MTKLENLRDFYVLWNVKNNVKKHWINNTKWGMVKCMHEIVLKKIIFIVQEFIFFTLNAHEMMTINNQQWINVHVYVMKNLFHISILCTLEHVKIGVIVKNIIGNNIL